MKVLIAAAIFGISCGMYGCSNESKFAGRTMPATEAPAAPASSPGAAIQTTADANQSGVTSTGATITTTTGTTTAVTGNTGGATTTGTTAGTTTVTVPVVASRWVDVTTNAAGASSSCATDPGRCTFKQLSTSMNATANLGQMSQANASSRCAGLTYNGAAGWRLPSKEQLQSMFTDRYEAEVWTKTSWGGAFWSSSITPGSGIAYYVSMSGGGAFNEYGGVGDTSVPPAMIPVWNNMPFYVLCVQ